MKCGKTMLIAVVAVLAGLLAYGCARYQHKSVGFRTPTSYPNYQNIDGIEVAARAWDNRDEAKSDFGFDIVGAEVLPVQVVIDNKSQHRLQIVPDQTFLVTSDGTMFTLLTMDQARERVEKKTGWGEIGPGAGKGALLGAAAGALVGTAVGVLSSRHTIPSAAAGAVAGAAGGAIIGGGAGLADENVGRSIGKDLRDASLENKEIDPGYVGQGILMFPGEAMSARQLKLRVKVEDTGETKDLSFSL